MVDDLSEQYLVDCAYGHHYIDNGHNFGAHGCDGASTPTYFDYLNITNNGHHLKGYFLVIYVPIITHAMVFSKIIPFPVQF